MSSRLTLSVVKGEWRDLGTIESAKILRLRCAPLRMTAEGWNIGWMEQAKSADPIAQLPRKGVINLNESKKSVNRGKSLANSRMVEYNILAKLYKYIILKNILPRG